MALFTPRRCPTSQKIMYRVKIDALRAADDSYRQRGQRLWVYQCAGCGSWHLTHQPPIPDLPTGASRAAGGGQAGRGGPGGKPRSRKRGYKPRWR